MWLWVVNLYLKVCLYFHFGKVPTYGTNCDKMGSVRTWELLLLTFLEDLGNRIGILMVHKADSGNASDSEHGVWEYIGQTRCAKKGHGELGHSGPKPIHSQHDPNGSMASQ